MIYTIVPVKELERAKGRLAGVLSTSQRRALVLAMLSDVLGALGAARQLGGYGVISRDPAVLALATEFEADVVPDHASDLNGALSAAASQAIQIGATALLVVPADLPLLRASEVDGLVNSAEAGPGVVLAPASDGGTNALLVRPPLALPFLFGADSLREHQRAARERNLPTRLFCAPGFSLDVDRPDDLWRLAERGAATAAGRLLRQFDPPLPLPLTELAVAGCGCRY